MCPASTVTQQLANVSSTLFRGMVEVKRNILYEECDIILEMIRTKNDGCTVQLYTNKQS